MELVEFLHARLDQREATAARLPVDRRVWRTAGGYPETGPTQVLADGYVVVEDDTDWASETVMHIAANDPAYVLDDVASKRRIVDEHRPEMRTVEWEHDTNGKGYALCCPRCQNAEHTDWHPPVGQAGVLPEGFITPYVLAPCKTLRLLAVPFANHPDYRDGWRL